MHTRTHAHIHYMLLCLCILALYRGTCTLYTAFNVKKMFAGVNPLLSMSFRWCGYRIEVWVTLHTLHYTHPRMPMSISGVANFGDILYNTIVVYAALKKLFVPATMLFTLVLRMPVFQIICVTVVFSLRVPLGPVHQYHTNLQIWICLPLKLFVLMQIHSPYVESLFHYTTAMYWVMIVNFSVSLCLLVVSEVSFCGSYLSPLS